MGALIANWLHVLFPAIIFRRRGSPDSVPGRPFSIHALFVAHNFVVYMCCLMLAAGYSYILEMKSSAILMYRLWHCTIECALY
jgi:hypothetical protein